MKKFNRYFPQALFIGASAALVGNVLPAQAQVPTAQYILDNCPGISFLDKCDPSADVVQDATNLPSGAPGLAGGFNIIPLGAPAGYAVEGTGLTDNNGDPLTNIDFSGPSQVKRIPGTTDLEIAPGQDPNAVGEFRVSSSFGDFQELAGWEGTIKDLVFPGKGSFRGEPFPGSAPGVNKVTDFMVINKPGTGSGVIDGVQYSGVAFDLVFLNDPVYDPNSGNNPQTTVSIDIELVGYKLDAQGNRIEEQAGNADNFSVFANKVTGVLDASFNSPPDDIRSEFDTEGELFGWFGYDISFVSTPLSDSNVIPEPTTIISSLLLMGGGAFKLSKRKKSV